jgi:hypothetical protein
MYGNNVPYMEPELDHLKLRYKSSGEPGEFDYVVRKVRKLYIY